MSEPHDNKAAKSAILGKIRRSLSSGSDKADTNRTKARQDVLERLAAKPLGIVPKRAQVGHYEKVAMFMDYAEKVSSSTARIASYDELPGAICDYLRTHNLPQAIVMGSDPRLAAINWKSQPQLERTLGPSDGTDLVGVNHAMGGVAETGTAILASGPDNPTTINFLPENHIIVVHADDIYGDYESVHDHLRGPDGVAHMPRALNMITGPSRSGDIEQKIMLGAHGPRAVHVIVVG
nr:LUD domain-containing protein [uncultured Cohaesibacter sp.]